MRKIFTESYKHCA